VTEPPRADHREPSTAQPPRSSLAWVLFGVGAALATVAALASPSDARSAASQDLPPFVLVAGLLLIGLVAEEDGLFATAGHRLAHAAKNGVVLYVGVTLLVALVTATLNLDTSVAFLTPVLVHTARSRGEPAAPLLAACILLSNAGSLFLPGSNLTNLIVLGDLHVSGGEFFAHMWLPATTALGVTAVVIALFHRTQLHMTRREATTGDELVVGLGVVAIVAATVIVLVTSSPAIPVAVVGVTVISLRLLRGRESWRRVVDVLSAPILIGLFGVAVASGTLGRVWSGPSTLLGHLDTFGAAVMAALSAVAFNNLPATSLLAARPPPHPYSLLIGLDLGPNLFVTGSLAWVLWLRSARAAGASPSIRDAARIGAVAVPLSVGAAVGVLVLTGSR
jgi:arsenical pump membrane protein